MANFLGILVFVWSYLGAYTFCRWIEQERYSSTLRKGLFLFCGGPFVWIASVYVLIYFKVKEG